MSQKKIKFKTEKKKQKKKEISPKQMLMLQLDSKRTEKRYSDEEVVVSLIESENFDIEKRFNYKYISKVANELGWTKGRFNKTLKNAILAMKNRDRFIEEIEKKKKEEEKKEKEEKENNEDNNKAEKTF